MIEPTDHTSALLCRMDAKLDRLLSDVTDLRGRMQCVEGRLTSLDAHGWRLTRIEAAKILAEPPGE